MALKRGAVGLAFMVSLMALCGASFGAVYKVGESDGWTDAGNVDYQKWASSKTFYVDDIIVFEYNKIHHNVIQVDPLSFAFCMVLNPLATYSTGKDYITLYKPGRFSFTCGFPGHCKAGQKVTIMVHPAHSMAPVGSPSPGPTPSQDWAPTPAELGDSATSPASY